MLLGRDEAGRPMLSAGESGVVNLDDDSDMAGSIDSCDAGFVISDSDDDDRAMV